MKKEIYAGLGLGLLIGVIIGLSIAQVTGIILGALTSLLAAFFGLQNSEEGKIGNKVIIGTFSFTCLLSIFLGLYIRTHDLLSPSLENDVKTYRAIKLLDEADIKRIILFKEFGLVPEGYTFSEEGRQSYQKSLLMSGNDTSLYLCLSIGNNASLQEIKEAFNSSGGKYSNLEKKLSTIIKDSTELHNSLLSLKEAICN